MWETELDGAWRWYQESALVWVKGHSPEGLGVAAGYRGTQALEMPWGSASSLAISSPQLLPGRAAGTEPFPALYLVFRPHSLLKISLLAHPCPLDDGIRCIALWSAPDRSVGESPGLFPGLGLSVRLDQGLVHSLLPASPNCRRQQPQLGLSCCVVTCSACSLTWDSPDIDPSTQPTTADEKLRPKGSRKGPRRSRYIEGYSEGRSHAPRAAELPGCKSWLHQLLAVWVLANDLISYSLSSTSYNEGE